MTATARRREPWSRTHPPEGGGGSGNWYQWTSYTHTTTIAPLVDGQVAPSPLPSPTHDPCACSACMTSMLPLPPCPPHIWLLHL